MAIDGGAMLGYCVMDSVIMEMAPPTMMRMAMTHAKTGRSIKNRDMQLEVVARGARYRAAAVTLPGDWGSKGTGLIGIPGRIFCRLSAITRSPVFRPSVTSHWLPTARSAF